MLLQGKSLPRLEYSIQPQSKHLAVGRCSYFMVMSNTKVPITWRGRNIQLGIELYCNGPAKFLSGSFFFIFDTDARFH